MLTILVKLTDLIDGSWTIAIERSDEAGRELARSLLLSRDGHRPVTLVGYSMGASAINSCLKELAKYQEKWETMREEAANEAATKRSEAPKVVVAGKRNPTRSLSTCASRQALWRMSF